MDDELHRILRGADAETLLAPLAAYNAFAQRYGCDFTPSRPFWERSFGLPHGLTLKVRGLNTTLVSGPGDDNGDKQLIGKAQATIQRADDVETVILAHHPPSWLLDQESFDATISTRARLQMFGHRHEQWMWPTPNGIALIGGALHPPPREKSIPRYNLVSIAAAALPNGRDLEIVVCPRRWTAEETCFMADYNSQADPTRSRTFSLAPPAAPTPVAAVAQSASPLTTVSTAPAATTDDLLRRLAFRLQSLPPDLQIRVGTSLSVPIPPSGVPDHEYIRAVLDTADRKGELGDVWVQVEQYHGSANRLDNPFSRP